MSPKRHRQAPLQERGTVSERGGAGTITAQPENRQKACLAMLLLLAAVLVVYSPAWQGGMLWDDDAHITPFNLRSTSGLARIWFEVGATQQYYPLVHSAFWLQYRLWDGHMLGYHLVNIILHSAAAFLIIVVLRRLSVPGAWLAGLLFALHPV